MIKSVIWFIKSYNFMNKATKITLSVLIFVVTISIFISFYFIIFNNNKVDFDLQTNHLTIYVDDTIDLKEYYTVKGNTNILISCFVSNISFADISEDNILTAKAVGETKILFKFGNKTNFEKNYINLTITEKPTIPTEFHFDKTEVTLSLETEFVVNNLICKENYNVTPTISYSINNICEYNIANGKITPLSIGSTIVTVTFVNGNNIVSNSFSVVVKNNYRSLVVNLTKEVEYYNLSIDIEQNKVTTFEVKVYEDNKLLTNVKVKFEFLENVIDASILQYEANLVMIKVNSKGQGLLKIYCEDDPSIFELVKIEVY